MECDLPVLDPGCEVGLSRMEPKLPARRMPPGEAWAESEEKKEGLAGREEGTLEWEGFRDGEPVTVASMKEV